MSSRWMIRKGDLGLMGPVSAEAVISMIDSGKLGEEDEVCQGNGYWFYISETILVEKFLKGGQKQPFNPVGAIPSKIIPEHVPTSAEDEPVAGNITNERTEDSNTQVIDLNAVQLNEMENKPEANVTPAFVEKVPSNEDLEYPEESELLGSTQPPSNNASTSKPAPKQEERRLVAKGGDRRKGKGKSDRRKNSLPVAVDRRSGDRRSGKKRRKDRITPVLLKFIVIVLISLLFAVLYYYVGIKGQPLPFSNLLSSAHAQSFDSDSFKKKIV